MNARAVAASDTSSVTLQSTDLLSPPPESAISRPVPIPTNEANPWLAPRESSSKAPRKKNEVIVGKDSAALDKSKNKLKKQTKKLEQEKDKAKDDAMVEISMDNVMALDAVNAKDKVKIKSKALALGDPAVDNSDANSEIDEQEKALQSKGKKKGKVQAFEQRDLVARAFAGDNVVQVRAHFVCANRSLMYLSIQAFDDAKRREMAEDAPTTVDTTIPGWVSY